MSDPLAKPIDARTRYCAVLGKPVTHSASPAMHNAAIAALGLNWRYLAFEVYPENLAEVLQGARAMNFIGLNLTVPHKVLALQMVDVVDESARSWGAVNTVRFEAQDEHGTWRPMGEFKETPHRVRSHGFNTDAEGITRSLQEDLDMDLRGASVLLLGAGGAGRTAALKLASDGVRDLFLINRTASKAEQLADEIHQRFGKVRVQTTYPSGSVDLVLNATSLGLKSEEILPLDPSRFSLSRARAVYDMIYRPAETPLLRLARQAECRTANGVGMLLHGGAASLALWTGLKPPLDIMRRALEENIYGAKQPSRDVLS